MLQFDGQLCELSAEEFAFARFGAWFAKELSFDKLAAAVRDHLDSTAVRLEKVLARPRRGQQGEQRAGQRRRETSGGSGPGRCRGVLDRHLPPPGPPWRLCRPRDATPTRGRPRAMRVGRFRKVAPQMRVRG